MDNQLMLGVLLIIVGIALALIAVAVVLNRREDRLEAELQATEMEGEETVESSEAREPDDAETEEGGSEEAVAEASESGDEEQPAETPASEIEPSAPVEAAPSLERLMVAEIYREEVTGELIVRVGDEEYRAGESIEDERNRRRLASAAADLSEWLVTGRDMREFTVPESATPSDPSGQMLVQINDILQRSLAKSETTGVRLIPDASGGVKVLIGVKSYEIEEVPDEDVKGLIREAVAEWEAGQ